MKNTENTDTNLITLHDGTEVEKSNDVYVQLTCGPSEGEFALENDCESFTNRNWNGSNIKHCWLEEEEQEALEEIGVCRLHNGELYPSDNCCFMDSVGEYYHVDDCCYVEEHGEYLFRCDCVYSHNLDQYIYTDETEFHYWESDEDFHSEPEGEDCERERINDYHCGINPLNFSGGDTFAIGFEVEKSDDDYDEGSYIEEESFFSHWETDSSCGIEGISNIFGLGEHFGTLESAIKNSCHLDLETSPACGGHITISRNDGKALNMEHFRKYAGLFYALWRFRLKNSYCSNGKKLESETSGYSVIRKRFSNCYEIRLAPRVKSGSQIAFRSKLMKAFTESLVNGDTFARFLFRVTPLLSTVYDSPEKLKNIKSLAKHFNAYLQEGKIHNDISHYDLPL